MAINGTVYIHEKWSNLESKASIYIGRGKLNSYLEFTLSVKTDSQDALCVHLTGYELTKLRDEINLKLEQLKINE
jgi:hypothetical protein